MKKYLILTIFLSTLLQAAGLNFKYKEALTKDEIKIKKLIQNSKRVANTKVLLNDIFIFKKDLNIIFGAEDGPYFDPSKNIIAIPYFFMEETREKFKKASYDKREGIDLDTAVIDVLIHTIIHELGHALISMYDIPVLGREEDAVDNLANILLIDFFDNGDDILLTNADIYDLYGDEKKEFTDKDFMGEHSLDLQRFYSLLCFVYASNPKKYEKMLSQYEFPMYRKDMCVNDLNNISRSWYKVLKPYMRD